MAGFWTKHWRRVPAVDRFLQIDAKDAAAVCPGREPVEPMPSWENRLFRCGDRVVKFYRPGRWTRAAVEDEHRFLQDLDEADISVACPVRLAERHGIVAGVFDLIEGRERHANIKDEEATRIGRLLARVHEVGAQREARHRGVYDPREYGVGNLLYLIGHAGMPKETGAAMLATIGEILDKTADRFAAMPRIRIHGDVGLENMMWTKIGPVMVDFDDMLMGPPVHDVWLIGRDAEVGNLEAVVNGYRSVRLLPDEWLSVIPAMAALRVVWGNAWMLSRHYDRVFRDNLPAFGTDEYWSEQLAYLQARLDEL